MSDEQIPFRLHFRADSPFAAAERHAAEIERLSDVLHQLRRHPDYEYDTTTGPRKAWDVQPPEGGGWERNVTTADPDAWERFDYHEEARWRRRKAPEQ